MPVLSLGTAMDDPLGSASIIGEVDLAARIDQKGPIRKIQTGDAPSATSMNPETTRNMTSKGCLYGLSLGPGDPGLITRRAWELLQGQGQRHGNGQEHSPGQGPSLWAYPVRKWGGDSFALDIVQRAGLAVPDDAFPLCFPMTHNPEVLAKHWLAAAQTVLEHLERGRDVCFLVEGDASTYSTFGHLARTVTALDPAVRVEVIAGVTSYQAAAAHLGVALADADDTLAILPAGYGVHTIDHLLDEFDALVLLKVKPLLDDIIALLERRGLLEHARFVEKVGCPEERTVHDLTQIRGETVNYLSLLLVHNPHRAKGETLRGCRKKAPGEKTPNEEDGA